MTQNKGSPDCGDGRLSDASPSPRWTLSEVIQYLTAKVRSWDAERGFGFIHRDADQPDAFVHLNQLKTSGLKSLRAGDLVEFGTLIEPKTGRVGAFAVTVLEPAIPGRRYKGAVAEYHRSSGFASISCNGRDVFCPKEVIAASDLDFLIVGQTVRFSATKLANGQLQATMLEIA